MGKHHYIIPIFVPHKGCPFDCVFCNQKKITGCEDEVIQEEVDLQIKEYLNTMGNDPQNHIEIAFFGGSFTGIDRESQRELLKIAYKWKNTGAVQDIRISTRPDYIDEKIMKFLESYGVSIIELGVQSMDRDVLLKSGRGHTPEDVIRAVGIMKQYRVRIGLQMMVGLPGDNEEKVQGTADQLIELKPDFIRIYPTLIVRDTHLENMYRAGTYTPLLLEKAVEIAKKLLLKFMKNNIPVIRIGLQPTENIIIGKEVVGGPFHPSFRQLVESAIYKDVLNYLFMEYNIKNRDGIEIQVNNKAISPVAGHKRANTDYIKDKYGIGKVKIIRNKDLNNGEIKIVLDHGKEIYYNLISYANNAI